MVMACFQPVRLFIPADINILSRFSLTSFECFLCSWTLIEHWCGVPELAQWWLPLGSGHFQCWYLRSDWRVWACHSFSHCAISGLQCGEGSPNYGHFLAAWLLSWAWPQRGASLSLSAHSRPCVDRYPLLPCFRAGAKVRRLCGEQLLCLYPFC